MTRSGAILIGLVLALWVSVAVGVHVQGGHAGGGLIRWLYGLWTALSLGVAVCFAPAVWRLLVAVLHRRSVGDEAWLCLGIFLSWTGSGLHRLWFWTARAFGRPDWMVDHWLILLPTLIFLTGAIVHLRSGLTALGSGRWWPLVVLGLASAPFGADELI